ncbi:MAG: squalene synthase HpnD [Betaproteobacteria bacterium]|nr:MAG: squalene synthase HpnD [Betaproteobacteria bacterium]
MNPDQYCQQKAAASGSSFYYAFRLLPTEKRAAITAFYAFCREVDDVVDEVTEPNVARTKLAFWRQEIEALFAGAPKHPVTKAIERHIAPMQLPASAFHTVIDGMQQDLEKNRYLNIDELRGYCYRAAGVVGEVSARIFGMRTMNDPRTLEYARLLGESLQLINIIRDVGEDARRGRIYLPSDELTRFGVATSDLLHAKSSPEFVSLMQFQHDRAASTYKAALAALPAEDKSAQKSGLAMAAIYRTLLEEIRRDGFRVLEHRVALTPIRKLWIACKTAAFA